MFKHNLSKLINKNPTFFKGSKKNISNDTFKNNFDIKLNKFLQTACAKKSVAFTLAGVNIALYLYVTLRTNKQSQFKALEGVSYSLDSMKTREWIPFFANSLGSMNILDLAFNTGVFVYLGKNR